MLNMQHRWERVRERGGEVVATAARAVLVSSQVFREECPVCQVLLNYCVSNFVSLVV